MIGLRRAARALALPVASLALVALPARAQDGGAPAASSANPPVVARRLVLVRVVGAAADPTLDDTLRELLARLDLETRDVPDDAPDGGSALVSDKTLARVEIDLTARSDARILVVDARTGEVRLRRSVPRAPSAAIAREEIAHTVQSAVESLLVVDRERVASQTAAPSPAAPAAAAPAPPPQESVFVVPPPALRVREEAHPPSPHHSPFALDLTVHSGIGPIGDGSGPDFRIGGGVVARWREWISPSLAIWVNYAPPFDTGSLLISTHTSVVSLRAAPAVQIVHAKWLTVDLGAGGGLDVLNVAPHSEQLTTDQLETETARADPILCGVLTASASLASGVVVLLSAAADVDLASRRYVAFEGTRETDVLSTWRVRPMILAGFGFTALGDSAK
ncbi:MAG TPA: hypothetical protein VGI39_03920 [Polyangiaceae bacterium]|jgi:hypothetical protein